MVKKKTDNIKSKNVSRYTNRTIKDALKQFEKIMTESPLMSNSSYRSTYFKKDKEFYTPIERDHR